jgi:hypothetical protein
MEINDLALSFYNAGFFNPQMADQALACLNMMDFTKKDEVMQKISENGTLAEMLLMYQQMALQLASKYDPQLAEQIANQIMGGGGQPIPTDMGMEASEVSGGTQEHPFVERARSNARESTQAD